MKLHVNNGVHVFKLIRYLEVLQTPHPSAHDVHCQEGGKIALDELDLGNICVEMDAVYTCLGGHSLTNNAEGPPPHTHTYTHTQIHNHT
jgi:hypothetical protein